MNPLPELGVHQVHVHGASDDLIEVDGALSEEFTYDATDANYLAFNDGTVLAVVYSREGFWRINPVVKGVADIGIVYAVDADSDDYSDKVTLTAPNPSTLPWRWVLHGNGLVRA